MAADSDTLKDDQTLEAEVLTEPVKVAKKPKEPQVIVEGEEEKGTLPGIGPEADQDIGYDPTEPDVAVQDVALAEQETQDHYEPTVISPGVDSSKASGKKPQTAESLLSVAESVSRLRNVDVETRKLEVSRLDIDESAVRAVLGVLEYESGDPRAKAIADEWEQSQIAALKQRRLSGAREAETVKAIDEIFGNSEYWEGEGQGNPTVETIISALGTEEKFPVSPLLGKRTESKKHRDALKAIYLADGAKGVMKYLNDNGFETRELQKLFMLDKYIKSTISEAPTRIAEAYQEEGVLGVFGELVGLGTLSDKKMLRETSQLAEGNMGFVEVVIRGDLLGKIRSVPGYENVKIGKIKKIPGGVGRYRIILSDGRELFSQIENYYPARLGALLFEAQGLMKTSDRYHAFSYGTGVVDQATQHEEKVMFGFTRDMHDFAKASEKVKIRMPDTDSMEEVTVAGVALKNDLMFSDLKDPAIVSELEARGSLEPVKAFRKMLKTEKGRAEIMRAWAAYHEMSRRAIGVDRFLRNTAIVLVKRDNPKPGQSEYVITFQPFDADFIGGGIVGKGDSLNFHGFDNDFAAASVKFVKELHFSAMRENIMISQKKLAMELLRAHEACDLSILPETRELSRIILHEHKDKTFGFPISEGIGSVPNYAGRKRVVVSPDGRMILNRPEELSGIQDSVTTPENHKEHSKRRRVQFVKEEGFMIKRADIQGLGPLK